MKIGPNDVIATPETIATDRLGEEMMQALAAARETLYQPSRGADPASDVPEVTPSTAQLQADALALLAETALHHELDPGAPGERYQVVVHVDATALADPEAPGQSVLEGGTHVPVETSRRLACAPPAGGTAASRDRVRE